MITELLSALIACPSITPDDAGCQKLMMDFLKDCGFHCQTFNNPPVANFFARYGQNRPLLVFAGHTDVVPVGDPDKWTMPPFQLTCRDQQYYGRGVADMKASLAAMLFAVRDFINANPDFPGSIGLLITSGEEGDDFDKGTPYVMQELQKQGIALDYCIVGEPSSSHSVGDVIKIGRRGSLTGRLVLHGKQGHVAYPHLADNPIHKLAPVLTQLTQTVWDQGNSHFPPTSLQITHLHSGGHASNIIPGDVVLHFAFRYCTEQSADSLKNRFQQIFTQHGLEPEINWRLNGEPFLTEKGHLLASTVNAITAITGKEPELSTSGGTSDGRFIAPYGVEVIELGPVNATIHQIDEHIDAATLPELSRIYQTICAQVFSR